MKKLLFSGGCLVALSASPVLAQSAAPVVAVVSIRYSGDTTGSGYLLIDRDGKIERKDVQGAFHSPIFSDESMTRRATVLRQTVVQLYQEGYVLKGTLGHSDVDELIFVKEK
jgi:hypothetical protein